MNPLALQRRGISSAVFIVITLACVLIVFGLCMLLVISVVGGSGESVESTERRLVYATNPDLLMDACTQIVQKAHQEETTSIDPNSPALAPIIRKVSPRTISVDGDRVTLECGTNVYRFGLVVDTAPPVANTTAPTTAPAPPMATRQLAPGAWYYAEDHAVPRP